MKIKEFEAVHSEICPESDIDHDLPLFVTAENAVLRPGPLVVLGAEDRVRLLQRCFPDRAVHDRITEETPALVYVNTLEPEALASVRKCAGASKELLVVAENNDQPAVQQALAGLTLRELEGHQVLAEKLLDQRPVCHWPWTEFTAYANRDIGVCCGAGGLANATPETAGTIWNHEGIRTIRQNLLRGEFKGICERCPFKTLYNQNVTGGAPSSSLPIFPKTMSLIITEKCSLKCWFCGYTTTYNADANFRIKTAPELSIDLLEELAPRFWKRLYSFNTNCGGEVFLYPHWNRVLELMKRYPSRSAICTTGGGINVSEEDWYKILETHTHWSFSVDSLDPQLHWIMRGSDLGIVDRNVEKLRRLRDAHFPSRVYGFSMVLMKLTVPTMFEFVRTAVEKYGAGHVGFQHVFGNPDQDPSKEWQWRQLFNCELNKVKHYCRERKISMGMDMGFYKDAKGNVEGRSLFAHPDDPL